MFSSQEVLRSINQSSLLNKKVTVHNADALTWLRSNREKYDAVVIDFPDPSGFSVGKLYSTVFYNLLKKAMSPGAVAVVQSTSPYVAPKSFWCVDTTLQAAGFITKPYHNYVPSFGEWGYIMAYTDDNRKWYDQLPDSLRYLNRETLAQLFIFPEDMKAHVKLETNRLNNQALVNYFEEEWGNYLE